MIEELATLKELEDFQRFLAKHPEIIGNKSVYDGLFRHIFSYLERREEVQAKNCVRFYHLLQYLQSAQEGSGIYWVFKRCPPSSHQPKMNCTSKPLSFFFLFFLFLFFRLLNKSSEQRREFEKEVDSRFDILNNQFVAKATLAAQATTPAFDQTLADLPLQVRAAIKEGNNEALNVLLRGMTLDEASAFIRTNPAPWLLIFFFAD